MEVINFQPINTCVLVDGRLGFSSGNPNLTSHLCHFSGHDNERFKLDMRICSCDCQVFQKKKMFNSNSETNVKPNQHNIQLKFGKCFKKNKISELVLSIRFRTVRLLKYFRSGSAYKRWFMSDTELKSYFAPNAIYAFADAWL